MVYRAEKQCPLLILDRLEMWISVQTLFFSRPLRQKITSSSMQKSPLSSAIYGTFNGWPHGPLWKWWTKQQTAHAKKGWSTKTHSARLGDGTREPRATTLTGRKSLETGRFGSELIGRLRDEGEGGWQREKGKWTGRKNERRGREVGGGRGLRGVVGWSRPQRIQRWRQWPESDMPNPRSHFLLHRRLLWNSGSVADVTRSKTRGR